MVAWNAPAVTIAEVRKPLKIWQPKQQPGIYVVDFGENLAGVCRISGVEGASGQVVQLRHGEILQHTGLPDLKGKVDPEMIYTGNLRGAKATDAYTLHGGGSEGYMPTQTYHGFRFVEVSGTAGFVPNATNIEMLHFHSANKQRSATNFSSDTLNQIQRMALGAQRSNMMTVPTDCDQRDERLGWMGDADLSVDSMLLNYGAADFFSSYAHSINDELGSDGSLPDTVPFVRYGNRPADVSWSAALPQIAWALYKYNGDLSVAKRHWSAIVQQFDNVKAQAAAGMDKMHTPYGDWCPPPTKQGGGQGAKPSGPYTSAYTYTVMAQHIAQLASALKIQGNWSAVAKDLVQDFHSNFFVSTNNTYDLDRQTDLALALDLQAPASPQEQAAVTQRLLALLKATNNHFSTGIIGLKSLLPASHANGA